MVLKMTFYFSTLAILLLSLGCFLSISPVLGGEEEGDGEEDEDDHVVDEDDHVEDEDDHVDDEDDHVDDMNDTNGRYHK